MRPIGMMGPRGELSYRVSVDHLLVVLVGFGSACNSYCETFPNLSEGALNAMMMFKLKKSVLLALFCIGGAVVFRSPVLGQTPKAEKKDVKFAELKNETDKDKLQGKWQIMSLAMSGKVIKREDKLGAWKETFEQEVTIQGDQFIHAQAKGGTFKLDETREPKQITFPDKDGKLTFRGIYRIDGDTITMCVNGDGTNARRPEEFATKEGTSLLLITLKKSPTKK